MGQVLLKVASVGRVDELHHHEQRLTPSILTDIRVADR
jgi:hypothetical protein